MAAIFKGIVHGKTIQLEEATSLPDGQLVDVTVEPTPAGAPLAANDGDQLKRYLEWNNQQRKDESAASVLLD